MRCFGLIGYPLSHSFSGKYFEEKFEREGIKDCVYKIYPIGHIGLLPELIRENKELVGLNVTIPYKEQILSFLDSVDEDIARIGAVNTIKICRQDKNTLLKGFNTDVYGFGASLKPYLKDDFRTALILGTGGASKAAAHVLNLQGLKVTFVSRNPKNHDQISYSQVTAGLISSTNIIVNASPIGMYPNIYSCPDIPYEYVTSDHVLFDLVYNPAETKFMAMGRSMGAKVINGLQMLHLQADKAWEIWNSERC
jgi:shikimate dehydrogenase